MGNWFCRGKEMRILIHGLDAAGKTTLLYLMKLNEVVTTIPTIGLLAGFGSEVEYLDDLTENVNYGFNVESVQVGNVNLTCWDLGGRDKSRPLFRHYYPNTQGFISVIDCSDKERLDEAIDNLIKYILEIGVSCARIIDPSYHQADEARDTPVMVLANKQDKEGALTAQEVEEALQKKYSFTPDCPRTVFVMPCSAFRGDGVYEAFLYLAEQMGLTATGKAKRGLISIKEREAQEEARKSRENESGYAELMLKYMLKNPIDYCKSFFVAAGTTS